MGSNSPLRLAAFLAIAALLAAQESKSLATEHTLKSHDKSPFFVVPPRDADANKPALLVVMPGGPGTADFLPWVENGILAAAPDHCVGVMVTACKWRDNQKIVWPTGKSKVPGMRYTTEDYVLAVVKQVSKDFDVAGRIAVLAWSSSGPAAYRLMARKQTPFDRAYVAMSVWPRLSKTEIRSTKGRRFVLDQSPDDTTTTFRHVRRAYDALHAGKAIVRLSTYDGGHGWHDSPVPRLRRNLSWLFGDDPVLEPVWPGDEEEGVSKDGNLVRNASFEKGTKGWRKIDNSGRLIVSVDKDHKTDGKRALHLKKTGAMPLDLVDQEIRLPKGKTVKFAVQVKTAAAKNAWVKLWLYDDDDQVVNKASVNVVQLRGTADWQRHTKTFARGAAVRAVVQIIMVMGGDVWLDDVVLTVGK